MPSSYVLVDCFDLELKRLNGEMGKEEVPNEDVPETDPLKFLLHRDVG